MKILSLRELTLELIQSTRKFVVNDLKHSSNRNALKYEEAMIFLKSQIAMGKDFDEMWAKLDETADCFHFCGANKQAWLAIEHCEDIFNSMNLRFLNGFEKRD